MNVELVAMSQPLLPGDRNPIGISERAACVCYDSKPTKSYRIVKTCMASGHTSVLEHISFTFRVKGISRACLAQLSRHRHISLSVRSQRYCREDGFDYVNPFREGSIGAEEFADYMADARGNYTDMVDAGVAAEDARAVLPNACCTELYLTANARSLMEMSNRRLCNRAQKEIRELFTLMRDLIRGISPEIADGMVPSCEMHHCDGVCFCMEHDSCGKYPKLTDLIHLDDE